MCVASVVRRDSCTRVGAVCLQDAFDKASEERGAAERRGKADKRNAVEKEQAMKEFLL